MEESRGAHPFLGAVGWLHVRLLTPPRRERERGDMPGWVLITVMTAALVVALWAIAGPQLKQMLTEALNSVQQRQ